MDDNLVVDSLWSDVVMDHVFKESMLKEDEHCPHAHLDDCAAEHEPFAQQRQVNPIL